jgi:Cu/Ag efflux pump CusA
VGSLLFAGGLDRLGGNIEAANAYAVEPLMRFLTSALEMVAPFDIPNWAKELYAVLALIAIGGLMLSIVMALFLLPLFYALYRARG